MVLVQHNWADEFPFGKHYVLSILQVNAMPANNLTISAGSQGISRHCIDKKKITRNIPSLA